jgi:peptidyl-prolyl cis-trans isomerase D
MLRSMRRNTKIIMLVVAVAFVGLMVFQWGMDISGRSNPAAAGEVGRVNGTSISYQLWTATYRNLTDQARAQKGSALNDRELAFLEDQAWSQLVNEILIDQELDRRGISVTDNEVRLAFQTTPPPWLAQNELFQTGGQFDYEKYREFFSNPAVDPQLLIQIEQYYRSVLPQMRLMEQIGSGIYVSDSELWYMYRDRSEQVRVTYLALDPELAVADTLVEYSDAELRSYYDEHIDEYRRPATVEVTLVQFSRVPSAADTAAALEEARRVRSEIVAGAEFAELAERLSADPGSARSGGDLGWFGPGEMAPEFEAAAFALEPGVISEPVLTAYGYHIIKVEEEEADRIHASHILIPIRLQGASEDDLLGTVDRFERIALTSGLEVAVDSLGVESRRITLAEGSDFVPGMGAFEPVHYWAFHDSTMAGELSPVYETDQGFHFFQLESRVPEGYVPFADVEPAVGRRVELEKKKEEAQRMAARMASELQADASLDAVATEYDLLYQTSTLFTRFDFVPGLGQGNAVIGAAFGLELNEIAGPIESDDRLFFVQLVERVAPSREEFEAIREDMRAQLTQQRQQTALDEWLAELREMATIEDFREQIFVPRS